MNLLLTTQSIIECYIYSQREELPLGTSLKWKGYFDCGSANKKHVVGFPATVWPFFHCSLRNSYLHDVYNIESGLRRSWAFVAPRHSSHFNSSSSSCCGKWWVVHADAHCDIISSERNQTDRRVNNSAPLSTTKSHHLNFSLSIEWMNSMVAEEEVVMVVVVWIIEREWVCQNWKILEIICNGCKEKDPIVTQYI